MPVIHLASLSAADTFALHSRGVAFDAAYDTYADAACTNAAGIDRYGFLEMTDATDSYSMFDADDMDYIRSMF